MRITIKYHKRNNAYRPVLEDMQHNYRSGTEANYQSIE